MVSYRHKFRFYLDENFPVPTGKFLRALGHTVLEGLKILKKPGLSDSRHLSEATKREAILLSFDRDFWVDPKHRGKIAKSHGIILISATDTKSKTSEKIMKKLLKVLTKNQIKGKICCVSVDKIEFMDPDEIK